MSEQNQQPPYQSDEEPYEDNFIEEVNEADGDPAGNPAARATNTGVGDPSVVASMPPSPTGLPETGPRAPATPPPASPPAGDPRMQERLERLGGEPAPVITPEEFARLQKQGQVNIDARGRVRTARRSGEDVGVSLRKRRAWYV